MSSFGEYLRRQGALEEAQLEEACRSQMVRGGRIGSSLVELGYMTLERLTEHLSNYHGKPIPPGNWLEAPDERALTLIPSALIRRYSVLPLHLDPKRIHVAMLDPCDPIQLRLIADMAKRDVASYVLPEISAAYWLEAHCGLDPHPRYAKVAARVHSGDEQGDASKQDFAPLAAGQELSAEVAVGEARFGEPLAPLSEKSSERAARPIDELLLEEITLVDVVAGKPDQGASCAPSGPGEIASLEAELQAAGDRDAVIELGLRLASAFASSVALFFVRDGMLLGHRVLTDEEISTLDAVLLPLDLSSLFTQPAVTGQSFRGRPPHDGMDGRILAAMGRAEAHEVLVEPISIRGRVVNVLYADNGGDALADTSVAALNVLAATMATAYERLIGEIKRER